MTNMLSAIQLFCHFMHSVSSQVFLHNFWPLYSKCLSSSYISQASLLVVFSLCLVLESSLQSNNVTYCPHAVDSCVRLRIRSEQKKYGICTDRKHTVQIASVGLAQAHSNNVMYCCITWTQKLSDLN